MANYNKVTLLGRVASEVKEAKTSKGLFAGFKIEVENSVSQTTCVSVKCRGKVAEIASGALDEDDEVFVDGEIEQIPPTEKGSKTPLTVINALSIQVIGLARKKGASGEEAEVEALLRGAKPASQVASPPGKGNATPGSEKLTDDDLEEIPF